jgi:hemerythrin-like domain-containing protein
MREIERRKLFRSLAGVGAVAASGTILRPAVAEEEGEEEDVAPAEDLMREHGVLKRILLVYDEIRERIASGKDYPPEAVTGSAKIIRTFIEEYHEKLEEEHLFPRFRKKGKLVELVDTLEAQHKAGRAVTERILVLGGRGAKTKEEHGELARALHSFTRMYAPHEAREDTVLFPALHEIVPNQEYEALGDDFEKKEHQLFGKEGFEGIVDKVAAIEKTLGIYELAQFTPK